MRSEAWAGPTSPGTLAHALPLVIAQYQDWLGSCLQDGASIMPRTYY